MAKGYEPTFDEQITEHNIAIEVLEQSKDDLLSHEREVRLQDLEAKKDTYLADLKTAQVKHKILKEKQDKSAKAHQIKVDATKEANRRLQIAELNLRQVENAINNA